jgi:uncharacterized protein YggE
VKPQHFVLLAGGLLLVAILLLIPGRPTTGGTEVSLAAPHTITVMGEGKSEAKPDRVRLAFIVSNWVHGASATEAEALTLASSEHVVAALKSTGASFESVEIGQPLVIPTAEEDYTGETRLTGHRVTRRVKATLTALQRVDAVIAAGLANGAVGLEAADYAVQESQGVRQRAVLAALESARAQAAAIAAAQDRALGSLIAVEVLSEEQTGPDDGVLVFKARVKATYGF